MLRVKNKKTINNIALKSLKANRSRNIIAALAIALTAILFTTLFTMGIGTLEAFQRQTIRQSGGDGHAVLKYISDEEYNAVKNHPLIKEISYNRIIADSVDNPEFLKRNMEMYYMDDTAMKLGFCEPTTGKKPEAENEIITDTKTLDLLGVPHETGVKIPLTYTVKGKQLSTDFVLSGFWESDPVFQAGFVIVSKAYADAHEAELANTYREDGYMAGAINSYIMFSNSFNMEEKLHKIITDSGYVWDDAESPRFIASNVNWAYLSSNFTADPVTLMIMIAAVMLVIFTGYLIIYNVFYISVLRDIRFYGLLKTIGTTGKQIRHIINRQALLLFAAGTPIGLIIGFFIGRALVPYIVSISNFSTEGINVTLNPWIFIGSALFALVTVFISTGKPARIAANVSPVEAVHYAGSSKQGAKRFKRTTDGGKLHKMALSNLGRSKKRTVLVVVSMSLSLILLNTIFTLSRGLDMDKYLSKFVDTDFLIGHANYFNMENFRFPEDELSESFIKAVQSQPGFVEGGRLYYNIYIGQCFIDYDNPDKINSLGHHINIGENGKPLLDLYGLEDLPLSRMDILEGEKDPVVLTEKMKTGRYIVEGLESDDHGNVYPDSSHYNIGDKVSISVDGKDHEYELLAKTKVKTYANTNRFYSDFAMYLYSEEYLKVVDRPVLMTYAFNTADGQEAQMEEFIKNYTEKVEPMMDYESKRVMAGEFNGLRNMLLTVGGVLSFIIGLIGILNFVNSMLTSIITRRQEFAMMQSIGMTNIQLRKMLCLEGLYYALATSLFSFILGIIFSVTVVGGIAKNLWFFSYQFVIWPLMATYPLLILFSIFIPAVSLRSFNKESIVERLRIAE